MSDNSNNIPANANEDMPPIPCKKKLDTSDIQYGTCRYCGQTFALETSGMMTSDDLDEAATYKCDCTGSKLLVARRKRIAKAMDNIDDIFKPTGTADGEKENVIGQILKENVERIINEDVAKITIDNGTGTKATITMTSKGGIKVTRNTVYQNSKEA